MKQKSFILGILIVISSCVPAKKFKELEERERICADELVKYKKSSADFEALAKEGYAERQRVRDMERNLAMNEGQRDSLQNDITSAEVEISSTQLKILQLEKDMQKEVAKELSEARQARAAGDIENAAAHYDTYRIAVGPAADPDALVERALVALDIASIPRAAPSVVRRAVDAASEAMRRRPDDITLR